MKRDIRTRFLVAGVAFALTMGIVSAAGASPTSTTACSDCHGTDPAVTVEATMTANDGVTATYTVDVSNPFGASGWAVFDATGNLANGGAETGSFSVAVGQTYTVWGASFGTGGEGAASVQISPVAPPPPSAEATPTGMLKIRIRRQGKIPRYTMTLVNTETSETVTVRSKRRSIVLKHVEYGTYALTLQVGEQTYTQTVVVERAKTKVTIRLERAAKRHKCKGGAETAATASAKTKHHSEKARKGKRG